MKKLFAALLLTACASMLNAAASYDGSLMPISPRSNTYSGNYGSSYSGSYNPGQYSGSYNPSQAPAYGSYYSGSYYNPSQAPNFNPNPTNYGAGDYYGNYGQSTYAYPQGSAFASPQGAAFANPQGGSCPSGRCVQGCNPRTGRSNFPPQQPFQQGPQGPYQPAQGPYPEGQYQPYPQGPFQQGQRFEGADQRVEKQLSTQEVQDSLRGMFVTKYNNVNASVNNGYVTLQGTVASQEDKNDLEQKVRKMDGVRGVNNQVTVQPAQKGPASSSYTQGQNPAYTPSQAPSSTFQGRQGDQYQSNPALRQDQTRNY